MDFLHDGQVAVFIVDNWPWRTFATTSSDYSRTTTVAEPIGVTAESTSVDFPVMWGIHDFPLRLFFPIIHTERSVCKLELFMKVIVDLEARWDEFVARLGCVKTDAWSRVIHPAYTQHSRAYHNLEHIRSCIELFDAFVMPGQHPGLAPAELALWFHDVAYDSTSKMNEETSVIIMDEEAERMKLPLEVKVFARKFVLATKNHEAPVGAPKICEFVLDIDMSILGEKPDVYDAYARGIRKEYAWAPEEAFNRVRRGLLEGLLLKPRIYHTTPFVMQYEDQAKENIRRELATSLHV